MSPSARLLLRRIALGLPVRAAMGALALGAAGGCSPSYPPCSNPVAVRTHQITEGQRGTPCDDLCRAFDIYGIGDAGIDAGQDDAGIWGAIYYSMATCELSTEAGTPILTCTYNRTCIGGRAPAGLAAASVDVAGAAGWLARAAHLERASVAAFEDLAAELAIHGAPARLTIAAVRAAADERRHAGRVAALARRRGASVPRVERSDTARRSLLALATDNAVEGCVREAYAALVAAHQAAHARDTDVRVAYGEIAADEARHALLSYAIHEWACARVSPPQASTLEDVRRAEVEAWRDAASDIDERTRGALGLPTDSVRASLLASLA